MKRDRKVLFIGDKENITFDLEGIINSSDNLEIKPSRTSREDIINTQADLIVIDLKNIQDLDYYYYLLKRLKVPVISIRNKIKLDKLINEEDPIRSSKCNSNTNRSNHKLLDRLKQPYAIFKEVKEANTDSVNISLVKSKYSFAEIISEDDLEKIINRCKKVLASQETEEFYYYSIKKDSKFKVIVSVLSDCQSVVLLYKISVYEDEQEFILNIYKDKLTGLYNRDYFDQRLNEFNQDKYYPLTLIIGDLNGLKLTNDAFGHFAGDKLLKTTADILLNSCRKNDLVCRWGGDEFAIILPKTDLVNGKKVLNRIKELCKARTDNLIKPYISLGIATKFNSDSNLISLIKEAEHKMYKDKLDDGERHKWIILNLLYQQHEAKHNIKEEFAFKVDLAIEFAKNLELSTEKITELKELIRWQDIGMIALDNYNKNDLPKEQELEADHPEIGYRIIKTIPKLSYLAEAILCHHENWDGSGYPQGRSSTEIPFTARFIRIINIFYKLTFQNSSFKKDKFVLDQLQEFSSIKLDPDLVEEFIKFYFSPNNKE